MSRVVGLLLLSLAGRALAVAPSHWMHTSEADFKAGTFTNVVATNLGDLKLSREVKLMLGQHARVSAVYAMAQTDDGTIYAGTGPEGLLLQVRDQKITSAAELGDNVSIFSLLVDSKGAVLIGTGGETGQIFRMDPAGGKPQAVFAAEGVQYIWAMVQSDDGTVYAATGPNGQLFQINPDGSHKVLYDSDENNLLSMLSDGKDSLYIGTDPNGLVYRVNRHSGEVFVVYDAAETEISALARDAQGNLYAATAQSAEPEVGPAAPELPARGGRPEAESTAVPIPSEPPANPKPPEVPPPSPGEPLPIPKSTSPKSMRMFSQAEENEPSSAPASSIQEAAQLQQRGIGAQIAQPAATGNAIYRIDPRGFVTELFRQQVMIFSMIERDGKLIAVTGSSGEIYQVDPAAEETSVLAKIDPRQVLCLLNARDGKIYLGTANAGEIGAMSGGFAGHGTYTSPVLDATQLSQFGKMQLRGSLPAGTTLKVSTRSGNVQESSDAGWSPWSQEISASEFLQIPSPSARFLQYRLAFTSDGGNDTPVVEEVNVAYQLPNLSPLVKSITIAAPEKPQAIDEAAGSNVHTISWDASDPNDDKLTFALYFRSGSRAPWVLIKDKLKEPTYDWHARNVADGRYQVKVEASDENANAAGHGRTASRVSDAVVIDNTPPVIGDLKSSVHSNEVTIQLKVVDRTSAVAALAYSVDSSTDWQAVLPSDNIADSPEEAYDFTVAPLSPGAHQVTLRAMDAHGNSAMESISLNIEKP